MKALILWVSVSVYSRAVHRLRALCVEQLRREQKHTFYVNGLSGPIALLQVEAENLTEIPIGDSDTLATCLGTQLGSYFLGRSPRKDEQALLSRVAGAINAGSAKNDPPPATVLITPATRPASRIETHGTGEKRQDRHGRAVQKPDPASTGPAADVDRARPQQDASPPHAGGYPAGARHDRQGQPSGAHRG